MVYMPGDVTGKDWKLARPYHGPFRITNPIQAFTAAITVSEGSW